MGLLVYGILNMVIYNLVKKIVMGVFDCVEKFNNGFEFEEKEIEVFRLLGNIYFFIDVEGEFLVMVLVNVERSDWKLLNFGDLFFLLFFGEIIFFIGDDVVWLVFINEVVYFLNNIVMIIIVKEKIIVLVLKLKIN